MPSVIRGSDNFDTAGGNAVKAWVNFNGTGTVAIRASFNVSSITDNGTGDYTVNFATALADANYAVQLGCNRSGAATNGTTMNQNSDTAQTSSSVRIVNFVVGVGVTDTLQNYVAIFR